MNAQDHIMPALARMDAMAEEGSIPEFLTMLGVDYEGFVRSMRGENDKRIRAAREGLGVGAAEFSAVEFLRGFGAGVLAGRLEAEE